MTTLPAYIPILEITFDSILPYMERAQARQGELPSASQALGVHVADVSLEFEKLSAGRNFTAYNVTLKPLSDQAAQVMNVLGKSDVYQLKMVQSQGVLSAPQTQISLHAGGKKVVDETKVEEFLASPLLSRLLQEVNEQARSQTLVNIKPNIRRPEASQAQGVLEKMHALRPGNEAKKHTLDK